MELDSLRHAAAEAFAKAGGDLRRLTELRLPGDQFHRVFLRP
jgi:hypothetical protein